MILNTAPRDTAAQIWTVRRHLSAKLREWPKPRGVRGGVSNGVRTMAELIIDILLGSAFVTGIVIAVASLFI